MFPINSQNATISLDLKALYKSVIIIVIVIVIVIIIKL